MWMSLWFWTRMCRGGLVAYLDAIAEQDVVPPALTTFAIEMVHNVETEHMPLTPRHADPGGRGAVTG